MIAQLLGWYERRRIAHLKRAYSAGRFRRPDTQGRAAVTTRDLR